MKREKIWIVVIVLVAFASGVVVGASAKRSHRFGQWGSGDRQSRMLELFSKKLELNPSQKEAVSAILRSKHEQLMQIQESVRPKFQDIRSQTHEQIRVLLDPDQIEKFDVMEAEFEAHGEKYRNKWNGGANTGKGK